MHSVNKLLFYDITKTLLQNIYNIFVKGTMVLFSSSVSPLKQVILHFSKYSKKKLLERKTKRHPITSTSYIKFILSLYSRRYQTLSLTQN